MKRLYIGNLPYQATESELQNWFNQAGITVDSVTLMRDRYSGEARPLREGGGGGGRGRGAGGGRRD